jgi:hypothetical protein
MAEEAAALGWRLKSWASRYWAATGAAAQAAPVVNPPLTMMIRCLLMSMGSMLTRLSWMRMLVPMLFWLIV